MKKFAIALVSIAFITGCSPKIGSKEWCADLKEKPKGEWTLDETKITPNTACLVQAKINH